MTNQHDPLAAALADSIVAIRDATLKQLGGMGKGKEPSARLQAAIDQANALMDLAGLPEADHSAHADSPYGSRMSRQAEREAIADALAS